MGSAGADVLSFTTISCTIVANVNIVENTDSMLMLSWKEFCPKDTCTLNIVIYLIIHFSL